MKVNEFFAKYANTPLKHRFVTLNMNKAGMTTLTDVYRELQQIEDKIRPDIIREQQLLELAETYYSMKVTKTKKG